MRRPLLILCLAAAMTILTGCACGGGEEDSAPAERDDKPRGEASDDDEDQGDGDKVGEGRFKIKYSKPDDKKLRRYHKMLKGSKAIEDVVDAVNEGIGMPEDVTVEVKSGDGPLYDPNEKAIWFNLEFMANVEAIARRHEPDMSDEEIETFLLDVAGFVMLHEIGHALVDVLELPVVGKEEDAVDGLATVFITEFYEDGSEIALSNAQLFDMESADSDGPDEEDFWDEHSLDQQRFASIVCWVYGSDPKKNRSFIEEDLIPEERAEACPEEFEQKRDAWLKLLDPYMKAGIQDL